MHAAGVTSVTVHAKPVVTIFSTGDEVVPADTRELKPGQVRDATAVALAALVADAGGEPVFGGIMPDDPGALETALRDALPASDVIVISAGSSVGARDETAAAVRVIIECRRQRNDGTSEIFGTVGVSGNIIDASWQALVDAYDYHLLHVEEEAGATRAE